MIPSCMPELVELELNGAVGLTQEFITELVNNCQDLKELSLYNCREFTDDFLNVLLSGLPKLRRLNISMN